MCLEIVFMSNVLLTAGTLCLGGFPLSVTSRRGARDSQLLFFAVNCSFLEMKHVLKWSERNSVHKNRGIGRKLSMRIVRA